MNPQMDRAAKFPTLSEMREQHQLVLRKDWKTRLQTLPKIGNRCDRALHIARRSQCPGSRWRDVIAPLLVHGDAGSVPTLLEVGANVGYDLLEWYQRFAAPAPTAWQWLATLRQNGLTTLDRTDGQLCGICWSCVAAAAPAAGGGAWGARAIAIDLNGANIRLIQQAAQAWHMVNVSTHHYAVSNVTGLTYRVDEWRAGSEWGSLADASAVAEESVTGGRRGTVTAGADSSQQDNASASRTAADAAHADRVVGTIRLDDFAGQAFGGVLPRRRSPLPASQVVSLLSVDAEGFDSAVLSGAASLLRAKRIRVLEFEVSEKGLWATAPVRDTLDLLLGYGYECFWQGNLGQLAAASGRRGDWCAGFGQRQRWGNLVCAHEAPILALLRNMSI